MSYRGQPLKRFEDARLLLGQGSYVADIQLPGMLHAAVVRSPHAHALLKSVDVSAARSLPGVVTVITGEDTTGVVGDVPTRSMTEGWVVSGMKPIEQPVLAWGKVCYVGQPVAIVVAQDPFIARDGAELVVPDYEPLPAHVDPLEAMKDGATPIHQELGTNLGLRIYNEGGDLDAAFAQADHVVRQRYVVQRLSPVTMETKGVVAHYQPSEDLLTVWNSTQSPHRMRVHLAELFDRPENSFRVIAPDVGGGFGEKGCLFPEDISIPYLSLTLASPVKWIEDRQENMLAFHGRGHTVDVEAAVKKDGTILGLRVRIVADLGAYFLLSTPSVPYLAGHRVAGPYKTPAMSVEVLGVITNKPSTGAYRGAGGPESAFCMERTVDLIAQDLELDPAEVRRINLIPPDAFPYKTPTGVTYDSGSYEEGLDRVLELSEYSAWRERARLPKGPGEPLIGVGLATVVKAGGAHGDIRTESARVTIDSSGQITAYTGVSPHGQGTETSFAQIAADDLGVTPPEVQFLHSDTAVFPTGGGTAASRGTVVGGSALYVALQDAKQKLTHIASNLLECSQEDVTLQDGRAFNRHQPDQSVSFRRVAAAAYNEELLPDGVEPGLDFNTTYTLPENPYAFGAHVVVVEVSQDTGEVKILRYVGVHDSGPVINPLIYEGQVHGAIAQGIGQALTEGMVYSPEGQPLTGSLMDYAVPIASEMPDLILGGMETPSPVTPHGSKGVGELPTVAAPAAVANAVMDALSSLGVRHIDTPLTPEKIWRSIQEHQRGN